MTGLAPDRAVHGALLASGPGAVASHRTAAVVWGAPVTPGRLVDVSVPLDPGREIAGVRLHALEAGTFVTSRHGLAVVDPVEAVLGLSAVGTPSELADAVEHLRQARIITHRALADAVADAVARSRPGLAALCLVLDELRRVA
jgi:hypothetical protein